MHWDDQNGYEQNTMENQDLVTSKIGQVKLNGTLVEQIYNWPIAFRLTWFDFG